MERTISNLEKVFAEGGELSKAMSNYEFRPSQLEMARLVDEAFQEKFNLIVEAYERAYEKYNRKPTTLEAAQELSKIKNYPGALGNLNVIEEPLV